MFVVGLTGGIGSGKSTVATLFAAKNVPIIDADELARKVTQIDTPALKQIVEHFGENCLLPDGHLDRAALKKIVFADENKRKKLEELLHPLIRAEMNQKIATLDAPYCIVVIPLLLETTPNPLIDRVLIVDCTEELQISRTMSRDNAARETVETILQTQITRSKRLEQADDIIINNGTLTELIPQVDQLHTLYLSLANQQK